MLIHRHGFAAPAAVARNGSTATFLASRWGRHPPRRCRNRQARGAV